MSVTEPTIYLVMQGGPGKFFWSDGQAPLVPSPGSATVMLRYVKAGGEVVAIGLNE